MDAISGVTGSSAWSQDPELVQKLDETYCKHLRPHIDTDGTCDIAANVAWESYCVELAGIFSKHLPDWEPATPVIQDLSREYDFLSPMITSSYIEDLSGLWTEVHPALLEVRRINRFSLARRRSCLCRLLAGWSRSSTTDRITITLHDCTTPRSHSGVTRVSYLIGVGASKNQRCSQPCVPIT
jgi:hypothetical protein